MGGSQILRAFLVNDQGRPSLNLAGIDKRRRSPRDAPAWYTRNEVLVEGDSQGHTPGGSTGHTTTPVLVDATLWGCTGDAPGMRL